MYRVAINGYGNLGRGVERALDIAPDMECVGVFTRRNPETVKTYGAPVFSIDQLQDFSDKIDVVINCGGSATDLQTQTPQVAKLFNVVDSFDTHAKVPEHFAIVDAAARENGHTAIISSGWDPGVFSMIRVLSESVLPQGRSTTFWGRGVSQGHSDAIRRIEGVLDARQYTVPVESTVEAVKAGEEVELTPRTMHTRECYVVAEEGADLERIEHEIVSMPNYFADYNTTVHFISADELAEKHSGIPHGGQVIRTGSTSEGVNHSIHFELTLDSNPEFTGSVLVATARACTKKSQAGSTGAYTMFDVTLGELSAHSAEDLRAHSL
ncbi:diaminopimelate dehydrogenase [Alloscardovia omnicolens]|uniref:diaminopimelate dehydrogenase n=1 Tax=Alloscardovia omnicolens TaxID=419015 RepID=UPI003A6B1FBB